MPSTRSTSSTEDIISYIDEKFNNKFDELYKSNEELKLRIIFFFFLNINNLIL